MNGSIAEHVKDHIALGLDFRFPAEGSTYFLFSAAYVRMYIDGELKMEWTK